MVSSYFFRDAKEHDDFYDVSSKPRVVKQNTPLQVGYNVLQEVKLQMLQFNYDCINKYFDRKIFNLCKWIPIVLTWHFQTILTN